jgi:hypothetical protein
VDREPGILLTAGISVFTNEPAPPTGTIVGNDGLEHGKECILVDLVGLIDRDGPPRLVFMAGGDDPLGIRERGS